LKKSVYRSFLINSIFEAAEPKAAEPKAALIKPLRALSGTKLYDV
jgi:hypothetical protein